MKVCIRLALEVQPHAIYYAMDRKLHVGITCSPEGFSLRQENILLARSIPVKYKECHRDHVSFCA